MKNVLELLERANHAYPLKTAFADEAYALTFGELTAKAKSIGTALAAQLACRNRPIAVLMRKEPDALAAFFGAAYSGNFYVVLDCESPNDRLDNILRTLSPAALITKPELAEKAAALAFDGPVLDFDTLAAAESDKNALKVIRDAMIDTDPLYALFTSGSTGTPKGAVVSHRSVLAYAEWVTETFTINENTVFGSQTPFYFSMSVLDVYATIMAGATFHIIPKAFFSFPVKLLEFLNERRVNTIYWVPSAMCIIANWKVFDYVQVPTLKKVLFAGEVMPVKQLNYWIRSLPGRFFANLYGPTEVTDICAYYVVNREFTDDQTLPIGRACNNCGLAVIRDDGTEAAPGEEGELIVRGSFLAMGYYDNPERTAKAFTQNPLNPHYPETVYHTGDLVKYNEYGELEYITRKDFQIKHMGYRIELGEVEAAVNALPFITACVSVYDPATDTIVLIYEGKKCDDQKVYDGIRPRLPDYMMPGLYKKVKNMPYNANGKLDRAWLKAHYQEL